MARFTGVPELPQSGTDEWQLRVLEALKQNVELLTGTRNEPDGASRALLSSNISVVTPPDRTFTAITARGAGFTIANVQVPSYQDYVSLCQDIQKLGNDVANLHATLTTLINQLRR
jgi:hypothetical protein